MNDFIDKEQHPSYATLGFHRVSCGSPVPLFGSSIKHNDIIVMKLQTAKHSRGLNEDWYYADKVIAEVEMSSTQFADLITGLNRGEGVPVTLTYCRDGELQKIEDCPFTNRGELHRNEFKEHLDKVNADTNTLIEQVEELFESKKTLNKTDKQNVIKALRKIKHNIGVNSEFQVEQFDRQMEKTTMEAKSEIEALFNTRVHQLAKEAMIENPDKLLKVLKAPVIESEE